LMPAAPALFAPVWLELVPAPAIGAAPAVPDVAARPAVVPAPALTPATPPLPLTAAGRPAPAGFCKVGCVGSAWLASLQPSHSAQPNPDQRAGTHSDRANKLMLPRRDRACAGDVRVNAQRRVFLPRTMTRYEVDGCT
jgi:hypothetical protein